jgi:hypothetical protein
MKVIPTYIGRDYSLSTYLLFYKSRHISGSDRHGNLISFKDKGEQGLVNPRSISQPSQSKDRKKTRELEKKLKEKELEIEILKKFQAFLKGNE